MKIMRTKRFFLLAVVWICFPFSNYTALHVNAQNTQDTQRNQRHYAVFNSAPSFPHGTSRDIFPASPQASSLGLFGQIPVSNFTGTPQIAIPLYEIRYRSLSVPIAIHYHIGSVKPDALPGPVGLGWALQAGGVITRSVNSMPDWGVVEPPNAPIRRKICDFRAYTGWDDSNRLREFLPVLNGGRSLPDGVDPDKYFFNFNGHTGSFLLGHDGDFHIQSAQGEHFLVNFTEHSSHASFQLIDTRGNRFNFGGLGAAERTQAGVNSLSDNSDLNFRHFTTQTSWFLTSIESPNGYKIEFIYESRSITKRIRFMDMPSFNRFPNMLGTLYLDNDRYYLVSTYVLQEIVFPSGRIQFDNSDDPIHESYFSSQEENFFNFLFRVPFISSNPGPHYRHSAYRLDAISVFDNNNNEITKISFDYEYSGIAQRRRLRRVNFGRSDIDGVKKHYEFHYNPGTFPVFFSGKTDHWGFYNGIDFFELGSNANSIARRMRISPNARDYQELLAEIERMQAPNPALVGYELLTKIIYPTGGSTVFEYEIHDYGAYQITWPFGYRPTNSNRITGGARIRSIRNYSSEGVLSSERIFHYRRNFLEGGTASSGALLFTPRYTLFFENKYLHYGGERASDLNRHTFFRFTSNPFFPLKPHGNHIGYSEVTVEKVGSGYTVYRFKNIDNGFYDRAPLAHVANIHAAGRYSNNLGTVVPYWENDVGISRALSRGLVTSRRMYDINRNLKREELFSYNRDPDRNVRFHRFVPTAFNITGFPSYMFTAGVRYTYFPYLREKTVTENDIIRTQTFTYNVDYRLLTTIETTGSDNATHTSRILYSFDRVGGIYEQMQERRMFLPVESQYKRNNILLHSTMQTYRAVGSMILPHQVFSQRQGGDLILEYSITRYNQRGSIVEIRHRDGSHTTYLWGYNNQYPIVRIQGKTKQEVSDILRGNSLIFYMQMISGTLNDDVQIRAFGERLRRIFPGAFVTTFTYKPLVGVTSITDPRGITTFYEYDSFGRLVKIYRMNNGRQEVLQRFEYNFVNHTSECPPEPPVPPVCWAEPSFGQLLIEGIKHEPIIERSQQFSIHNCEASVVLEVSFWEQFIDLYTEFCSYEIRIINIHNTNQPPVFSLTINPLYGNRIGGYLSFTDFFFSGYLSSGFYQIELIRRVDDRVSCDDMKGARVAFSFSVHWGVHSTR